MVIIALIVSGVVVGREMIFTAKVRGTIGDFDRYLSMVNAFKSKYNCLPGDCRNASTFFGSPIPAGPSGLCGGGGVGTYNLIGTGACDGNGNNVIGRDMYGVVYFHDTDNYQRSTETYWLWQHLGRAGFIPDQYSAAVGTSAGHVAGQTTPSSRFRKNLGYKIYYDHVMWGPSPAGVMSNEPPELRGWSMRWYTPMGHYIALARFPCDTSTCSLPAGQMTPQESFAIDAKMDDGLPGLGRVKGTNTGGCTTQNIYRPISARYNLNNTDVVCGGIFIRYGD